MISIAMEGEISNLMIICVQVIASLCYCYVIGKIVPKGLPTLLAILPILTLFFYLPLKFHTMHLLGMLTFIITWLANSKLILFAFNKGPLSDKSLSLKNFIVIASLPIITHSQRKTSPTHSSLFTYTIKSILLVSLPVIYHSFFKHLPPVLHYFLFGLYIYLILDVTLTMVSVLVRILLGVNPSPPQFEPYLCTSLQDFWDRRWNLVANNILRLSVYEPTKSVTMFVFGPKWASLVSTFATFVASGLIHEIIFYYLGRVWPTWKVTCFFILHGVCVVVEVWCKKKLATTKLRLPRVVSAALTLGFVMMTAIWLFFPQLLGGSCGERLLQEFEATGALLKNATLLPFTFWFIA